MLFLRVVVVVTVVGVGCRGALILGFDFLLMWPVLIANVVVARVGISVGAAVLVALEYVDDALDFAVVAAVGVVAVVGTAAVGVVAPVDVVGVVAVGTAAAAAVGAVVVVVGAVTRTLAVEVVNVAAAVVDFAVVFAAVVVVVSAAGGQNAYVSSVAAPQPRTRTAAEVVPGTEKSWCTWDRLRWCTRFYRG